MVTIAQTPKAAAGSASHGDDSLARLPQIIADATSDPAKPRKKMPSVNGFRRDVFSFEEPRLGL
jgi:hypothetical protein